MQEQTDYYLGRQIGNYRLVKLLGGGAFGSVYQAQHIIFGDDVAIKILHANLRSQAERDRFFHEARILKTLQHPNILHILDAGLYEGVCYIVMDYAAGGSLGDHLKQRRGQALPQNEALAIIEQVGAALHDAHQHNIVHRDLKPDNILFDAKGNALLADFGIAVLLEKTSSVDVIGTPPYMAPEQFQGKISPRSDQYSLGIITYELLTGQRPFNAPSGDMFAWGWQHFSEAPTSLMLYNPNIPTHIEQAILKTLGKDREQRYSNVALFIQALSAFYKMKVGMIVGRRYEVTDVLDVDEQDAQAQPIGRVYHVIDHQGYQRCWNCGSEYNAEGDEFCIVCGAELLDAPYIMHEYPNDSSYTGSNQTSEAHALGNIVNTLVENGKTYVIEQPQEAEITFPNGVHLLVSGDSDAGDVHRSESNEDSILIMPLQRVHQSLSSLAGIFIIASSVDGHTNGHEASNLIVNGLAHRMFNKLLQSPLTVKQTDTHLRTLEESDLFAIFKDAIQDVNSELYWLNQRNKSNLRSTFTGFMIVNDHAYIINIGDNRTYLLREGTLYQLTTDHSMVGQLVAGGLIAPDDVYTHPQRSQIFRSLGDKTNVQIDDFKQQLLPGDILLSCSDGLWKMVRNPQIADILNNSYDPLTASTRLIEAANTNGGEDNVSVIIVSVR